MRGATSFSKLIFISRQVFFSSGACYFPGGLGFGLQLAVAVPIHRAIFIRYFHIPPNRGQQTLSIYAILLSKEGGVFMKGIGISLIIWGCIGILFGLQMFGDIGIACIWASVASILAGVGFLSVNKQIQNLWKQK